MQTPVVTAFGFVYNRLQWRSVWAGKETMLSVRRGLVPGAGPGNLAGEFAGRPCPRCDVVLRPSGGRSREARNRLKSSVFRMPGKITSTRQVQMEVFNESFRTRTTENVLRGFGAVSWSAGQMGADRKRSAAGAPQKELGSGVTGCGKGMFCGRKSKKPVI
jgi:hypothetical protein